MNKGRTGESYNIGGDNEWQNIKLVNVLCGLVASALGKEKDYYKRLITFVQDRPGHDRRYAINCDKIKNELGWKQNYNFKAGLLETVKWYLSNKDWVENIKTSRYKQWLKENYSKR